MVMKLKILLNVLLVLHIFILELDALCSNIKG